MEIFERGAGIRLGELETIADVDVSCPIIEAKLEERVPLEEVVISPAAISSAANLMTVHEN